MKYVMKISPASSDAKKLEGMLARSLQSLAVFKSTGKTWRVFFIICNWLCLGVVILPGIKHHKKKVKYHNLKPPFMVMLNTTQHQGHEPGEPCHWIGFLKSFNKWMFPKIGGKPQNGWFIMENPMNKWMIWGYPYFWKHPNWDTKKALLLSMKYWLFNRDPCR